MGIKRDRWIFLTVIFLMMAATLFSSEMVGASENQKTAQEIIEAYNSGVDNLVNYVRNHGVSIEGSLIEGIARDGFQKRNATFITIARIAAREKGDRRISANVSLTAGHYHKAISEYEEAQRMYGLSLSLYKELSDPVGQGNVYCGMADIYFYKGENVKATETYETALSLYITANELVGQAGIHRSSGDIYLRKGDYLKARQMYQKALLLYQQKSFLPGQGHVYKSLGEIYLRIRDFAKAEEMYDRAATIFLNAGDSLGQADVYWSVGQIHLRKGNSEKAVEMYEKAMPLYEKLRWAIGQGNVYQGKGEIPFYAGDYTKALKMYDRALSYYVTADDPFGQGFVYRRMGLIYMRTGDNVKALEMFNRAMTLYSKADDPIGQCDVYKAIGDIHFYTRDHAKALEMYDQSLPLCSMAQEPVGQGNVYRSMGDIYFFTGDNEKALEMYEKAMLFYQKANSPIGQGNVYRSMGDVHFFAGDYIKALEMQKKALPLYRTANSTVNLAEAYRSMGDVYLKTGNRKKAMENYEKGLSIHLKANYSIGLGNIYQSMGDVYLHEGVYTEALEMYEKALSFYKKIGDIESEAYTSFKKAIVYGREGKKDEALQLYEKGLARFERIRMQTIFPKMKKSYMEKVYNFYEDAAVFMLENHFNDKAFRYIEAMKARAFLDQLSEGRVDLEKGIDTPLKGKRDTLEKKLSILGLQIMEESQSQKPNQSIITAMKTDYGKTEEELEVVKREIRYKNPLYSSVQYPEPITLKDLQTGILGNDEIVLEYFISKKGCYCLVVSKDRYGVIRLAVDSDTLESRVDELLKNIKGIMTGEKFIEEKAIRLYEDLITPVEHLTGDKTIIIVPHGILAHLPYETLISKKDGQTAYLIEKHRIKYVQSASVLGVLRTQYKKNGLSNQFIGFGDPVYDYENFKAGKQEKECDIKGIKDGQAAAIFKKRGYVLAGGQLNRLKGSGEEVREIKNIFSAASKQGVTLLRSDAIEEYAKSKDMEQYGYIHFSTHGILDTNFQAIALSQIPDVREDGFLTLGEIMNSRYNAHLVVLSACETGLGKMERGEGVTGLTRAVMYAGAPAAVVSLWSVSDEATKELMIHFYRNVINSGMSKDEALRLAKIQMIGKERHTSKTGKSTEEALRAVKITRIFQGGTYSHPFFWSAFVMYGE
jgi:tetratricopeptide (TPR) repeat protein